MAPPKKPEAEVPTRGPFISLVKGPKGYEVVSIYTQGRNVVNEEVLGEGPCPKGQALDEIRRAVVTHFWDL